MATATTVTVTVHNDGDGYLTVDTAEWLTDRATRDDALTESLHEWLRVRDEDPTHRWEGGHPVTSYVLRYSGGDDMWAPETRSVLRWASFTFRGAPDLDDPYAIDAAFPFAGTMATFNEADQLLDEEIGAVWFPTDDGIILVTQASGAYGTWEAPEVYRVTCDAERLADYRSATAACSGPLGHFYSVTDGGTRLEPWNSDGPALRLSEFARVAFGGNRQWIACPQCSKALRFEMSVH